mmetsp:Transcript_48987/g.110221  ORF Transcript_48987/g.110221 Transcript_48987/m.110221 type:complete len:285 (-) Transcript_48987:449-1303(-)
MSSSRLWGGAALGVGASTGKSDATALNSFGGGGNAGFGAPARSDESSWGGPDGTCLTASAAEAPHLPAGTPTNARFAFVLAPRFGSAPNPGNASPPKLGNASPVSCGAEAGAIEETTGAQAAPLPRPAGGRAAPLAHLPTSGLFRAGAGALALPAPPAPPVLPALPVLPPNEGKESSMLMLSMRLGKAPGWVSCVEPRTRSDVHQFVLRGGCGASAVSGASHRLGKSSIDWSTAPPSATVSSKAAGSGSASSSACLPSPASLASLVSRPRWRDDSALLPPPPPL